MIIDIYAIMFIQAKTFPYNSNQNIHRYSYPDLGFDGILTRSIEGLYPKMLLNPFKEKLYLPPVAIKLGNNQCRHNEVVG